MLRDLVYFVLRAGLVLFLIHLFMLLMEGLQ
jgi:hypothetical protein